jgi:hypothetical protein
MGTGSIGWTLRGPSEPGPECFVTSGDKSTLQQLRASRHTGCCFRLARSCSLGFRLLRVYTIPRPLRYSISKTLDRQTDLYVNTRHGSGRVSVANGHC